MAVACKMMLVLAGFVLCTRTADCQTEETGNTTTQPNKDLYVIHATVYEVGILSNSSQNSSDYDQAKSENVALTFYHKNGTDLDLSKIPQPLFTNVTGQSLTSIASAADLQHLSQKTTYKNQNHRTSRNIVEDKMGGSDSGSIESKLILQNDDEYYEIEPLRKKLVKRAVIEGNAGEKANQTVLQIMEGRATVSSDTAIRSIAIPPLLSLNTNFSQLPVPIPNQSVINYTRFNSVIRATNSTNSF